MSLCDTCQHYSRSKDNCLKTTITTEMITENSCSDHEQVDETTEN